MYFDMLLSGGHLIDPKIILDGLMDLGVADGKGAAVGRDLQHSAHDHRQRRKVLDIPDTQPDVFTIHLGPLPTGTSIGTDRCPPQQHAIAAKTACGNVNRGV